MLLLHGNNANHRAHRAALGHGLVCHLVLVLDRLRSHMHLSAPCRRCLLRVPHRTDRLGKQLVAGRSGLRLPAHLCTAHVGIAATLSVCLLPPWREEFALHMLRVHRAQADTFSSHAS